MSSARGLITNSEAAMRKKGESQRAVSREVIQPKVGNEPFQHRKVVRGGNLAGSPIAEPSGVGLQNPRNSKCDENRVVFSANVFFLNHLPDD
jgi:hypothetical protein